MLASPTEPAPSFDVDMSVSSAPGMLAEQGVRVGGGGAPIVAPTSWLGGGGSTRNGPVEVPVEQRATLSLTCRGDPAADERPHVSTTRTLAMAPPTPTVKNYLPREARIQHAPSMQLPGTVPLPTTMDVLP